MRQTLIYRGEDGYRIAGCPCLPGCISQGQTREEAIENIREAIGLYIEALEADNLPVPEETIGRRTVDELVDEIRAFEKTQ